MAPATRRSAWAGPPHDGLVAERVGLANQLHALLESFWPGAATIFAELGNVRERFLSNGQLAAEAGVAPVTSQSGKSLGVVFRWACNHRLAPQRPICFISQLTERGIVLLNQLVQQRILGPW